MRHIVGFDGEVVERTDELLEVLADVVLELVELVELALAFPLPHAVATPSSTTTATRPHTYSRHRMFPIRPVRTYGKVPLLGQTVLLACRLPLPSDADYLICDWGSSGAVD